MPSKTFGTNDSESQLWRLRLLCQQTNRGPPRRHSLRRHSQCHSLNKRHYYQPTTVLKHSIRLPSCLGPHMLSYYSFSSLNILDLRWFFYSLHHNLFTVANIDALAGMLYLLAVQVIQAIDRMLMPFRSTDASDSAFKANHSRGLMTA